MADETLNIKGAVKYDELLSKCTTFRIGGPAAMFVAPRDEADLQKVLYFARQNKRKIFIIGAGSNILADDKGFDGIVVKIKEPYFCGVSIEDTKVKAGAGVLLSKLVILSCGYSLSGFEGLVGIPGTVGGALAMNAGYETTIGATVENVKVFDREGRRRILFPKDLGFGYRKSNLSLYAVTEAEFQLKKAKKKDLIRTCERLIKLKRKSQPLEARSAGCIFKNPSVGRFTAGEIIDFCGLKGKRIGGAAISRKHANFIVNARSAKSKDVMDLITLVRETVKKRAGVDLTQEIVVI